MLGKEVPGAQEIICPGGWAEFDAKVKFTRESEAALTAARMVTREYS